MEAVDGGCVSKGMVFVKKDIQGLIKALNSSDEWESGSALLELLDAGEDAVNPLLKAVNYASPGIRGLAVKALTTM